MITIRRIYNDEWQLFKTLRLASLKESPQAFSSTYESAVNRTNESWSEQAKTTATGSNKITFITFDDDLPIGIAALYRDEKKFEQGEILQVWIAPEYRGSEVAFELMNTIFQWAKENEFKQIKAIVTEKNDRALKFYLKYGFEKDKLSIQDNHGNNILYKKILLV